MIVQIGKPHPTGLNSGTGVPLYRQLENILVGQIHNGSLVPGDSVPGEHELAQRFDVSSITARRALTELAIGGLVTRERGRGTKVAAVPPMPNLQSSVDGWLAALRANSAEGRRSKREVRLADVLTGRVKALFDKFETAAAAPQQQGRGSGAVVIVDDKRCRQRRGNLD